MRTLLPRKWRLPAAVAWLLLSGALPLERCWATQLPPVITGQPANRTVVQSGSVSFQVTVNSQSKVSYQWQKNGANIAEATSSSYAISSAQTTDAGAYSVKVTNLGGSITSSNATLTVLVPPGISSQPQSLTVTAGQTASFSVAATGTTPLSYQWSFNQVILGGAANALLTLTNAQPTNGGSYRVVVTNPAGAVTSAVVSLTILSPVGVVTPPGSQTVTQKQSVSFSVAANGTAPIGYQWNFNGNAIAGATNSTLSLTNVQLTNGGSYSVLVTNPWSSASAGATLTVAPPAAPKLGPGRMGANGFSFQVSTAVNWTYVILASTDMHNWSPVCTNVAVSGSLSITDPAATNCATRFYRAVMSGQ